MPHHLKMFQWVIYSAVAVQAVEALLKQSWFDLVAFAVAAILVVACAWAAAREGSRFAVWVLIVFFIIDIITTIGLFWTGIPPWLQSAIAPDEPATALVKTLEIITNLLEVIAIYFYFSGDEQAASRGA